MCLPLTNLENINRDDPLCQMFQLKRPGSCDLISYVYYNELWSDIKFLEKVTSGPKLKIHTNGK